MAVKPVNPKSWTSWVRASDGYLRSDDPYGTYGAAVSLSALPAVSTSAPQFLTTAQIASLDMANKAYGATWNDTISGVPITRLTNASNPVTNTGCTFPYVEGGPWVSCEWGSGNHTIFMMVNTGSYVGYLVDYNRSTKALSNWRSFAAGDGHRVCWSSNTSTPRILYYITNASPGVLNRYDTSTGALANTGNFPHTFTASTAPLWLQTDRSDDMFVCMDNDATKVIRSWKSSNNTSLNRTFSPVDEPHLERDGRYVAVISGAGLTNAVCWDLSGDVVSNVGTTAQFFHAAHLRSGWISAYTNGSAPFDDRWFTAKGVGVAFDPQATLANGAANDYVHWCGHWIQSVSTNQQYALAFTFGHSEPGSFGEAHANHDGTINCQHNLLMGHNTLIYRRADGGDNRVLCHIGTNFTQANAGTDYYAVMGGISPDGKVVVFSSNMGTTGGRTDVFIVNVPLA